MTFNLPKENSSIIKVIGVGGGGSNAVNHMFQQGIKGVDFIVCNTDVQALDLSPVPLKIPLGATLTEGRGAGSIPEMGKNAAIESIEEIRKILSQNTKMAFITAGMGGGTGTGAAPIIAQTARELGILTVGIVTIPFTFEGKKRRLQADDGLKQLKGSVDALLIICNDRLREMYGNLKIRESFAKADDILTTAAKGIAEVITRTGTINVDFEDVKTVMKESGKAIMGSAMAEGDGRALKAVQKAMASPLLNDDNIKGARYVLLNITYGTEEILMDEISDITDYIQEEAGQTADVIWGHGVDEALGNQICVTVIATGFNAEDPSKPIIDTKKVVTLDGETKKPETKKTTIPQKSNTVYPTAKPQSDLFDKPYLHQPKREEIVHPQPKVEQPVSKVSHTVVSEAKANLNEPFLLKKEDVSEKQNQKSEITEKQVGVSPLSKEELQKKSAERLNNIKNIANKLKSPTGFSELEKLPAFMRRNVKLDDTPHSSDSQVSRYTLSEEDNGEGEKRTEIKPNNPFLHDNVD